MVPSSSGPGRLVLIQKIKGSTPFGITIFELELPIWAIFYFRSVNNSASNKEITHLDNSILEKTTRSQEENTRTDYSSYENRLNFGWRRTLGFVRSRSRAKTKKRLHFGFSEATP